MNPAYKCVIDVRMVHPVEDKTVFMRRETYLPFVPRSGDSLRFTACVEDSDDMTLELSLGSQDDSILYDVSGAQFEITIGDNTLVVELSETGKADVAAAIKQYEVFGFVRVNYPTVQIAR